MKTTRRNLLCTVGGFAMAPGIVNARTRSFVPRTSQVSGLAGKLGIVTASLSRFISKTPKPGSFTLLELPKVLKNELGLEVVDFNSVNLPSFEPGYLEKLRTAVVEAGCVATNLKMNQKVNMDSADPSEREHALDVYRKSIDAAEILGLHWVRPLPRSERPEMKRHIGAFRELIDYAGQKEVTLLIENFGWMMSDPDSVVTLADQIGKDVAIGLDTGNWDTNEIRYAGLRKTFPRTVTCDFKAKVMGENGEHTAYDLKKCFDLGWGSGFRGPWNFEHGHRDRDRAFREIGMLRDWLTDWISEKGKSE